MKPYDDCEFKHEKTAFSELDKLFHCNEDVEIYPNFELYDDSKKTYLECDLVVVSKNHIAVVELKYWRGEISVKPNMWNRDGRYERDPHRTNNRKCKVLKSTIEKLLPASSIPFVHSIVVLTHPQGVVTGSDTVGSLFKNRDIPAQFTFDGIPKLATYLQKRQMATGGKTLSAMDFSRVRSALDQAFGRKATNFTDQIPGYRVVGEIEHSDSFSSYLAEKVPSLGDMKFRLRVFGALSDDPQKSAKQTRSLKELETLPKHENIQLARQYPNEKQLVIEVTEWLDLDTLEQRLAQVGCMSWQHACGIGLGIAKALRHIHQPDYLLVHRNVSPRSIILNRDDFPQLTDFDLVYDPSANHTVFYVPSKEYLPYLAPEVHQGQADLKSDIYSLGVTLFCMLLGSPPKKRDKGMLSDGLTDQHLSKIPGNIPEELKQLLVDTMKFNAEDRPESDEVVERLQEILTESQPFKSESLATSSNMWQLGDLIAEGSTSKVYAGDCHGELAALKLYNKEVSKERCLHERDMLVEIDSPHIPKYKSIMQWDDNQWCLVMTRADGHKLKDSIVEGIRPNIDEFSSITNQLLETLSSMHPRDGKSVRVGVIHNDINPNNILYDAQSGQVTLIDFGAASAPGPVTYRGTLGYIDPDLIDAGELEASPSGDIYSLGISLWEWLAGKMPDKKTRLDASILAGCSSSQATRLSDWFNKCCGDVLERFSTAHIAMQAFHSVFEEDDIEVEELQPQLEEAEELESSEGEIGDYDDCGAPHFVDYLNTMHNVTADNAHALAEAQSVNPYFPEIYEPISLVPDICSHLTGPIPTVLILTGHAGDGKSTIALDVLKKLKDPNNNDPLDRPPLEEETVEIKGRIIKIIKDMSELAASTRLEKLKMSLDCIEGKSVSWLIVSNTGPLLSTFSDLKEGKSEKLVIEDRILEILNHPINLSISIEEHSLPDLGKPVIIVNLAKLNNVGTASSILGNIVRHPSWEHCSSCHAKSTCHISLNIKMLSSAGSRGLERVRWAYTRLSSYEQRMTLRQMCSHLAFSITAGFSCEKIKQLKSTHHASSESNDYLLSYLFSDTFFGGGDVVNLPAIESLYCVQLFKKHFFGMHSSPEVERLIMNGELGSWSKLSTSASSVAALLSNRSTKPRNILARRSLRRLFYLFADIPNSEGSAFNNFCSNFLKSTKLIELDEWIKEGAIIATRAKRRNLLNATLAVLLEEYSGFSIGQYGEDSKLYVTLKRSDRKIHQSSQLVLAEFSFDDFDLDFDTKKNIPKLIHKQNRELKGLEMSLPLLDYIVSKGSGDLEPGLDSIYLNQFDHFKSQLLTIKQNNYDENNVGIIKLLKSGISGDVKTYSYDLSVDNTCLEGH